VSERSFINTKEPLVPEIINRRVTAGVDGEFVVFLIGMRVNRPWKIRTWLRVGAAMPRMLAELYADPSTGFLGAQSWFGNPTIMVQYWRSFEALEAYARNPDKAHRPAWRDFNRLVARDGAVGIWHESYRVRPGDYEVVYNNMPSFGLARATTTLDATGHRESAAGRMAGEA
jgi:Domain of unknown function (DUF4188)